MIHLTYNHFIFTYLQPKILQELLECKQLGSNLIACKVSSIVFERYKDIISNINYGLKDTTLPLLDDSYLGVKIIESPTLKDFEYTFVYE